MANVTIDGKEYNLDDLSDNAKQQLASLQFVQSEIKRQEGQLAVYKTAAAAYSNALKNELNDWLLLIQININARTIIRFN